MKKSSPYYGMNTETSYGPIAAILSPEFSAPEPSLVLSKHNGRLHASKAASFYSFSDYRLSAMRVSAVKASRTRNSNLAFYKTTDCFRMLHDFEVKIHVYT